MSRKHEKEQKRRFRKRRVGLFFVLVILVAMLLGPISYVWFVSQDARKPYSAIESLEPRPVVIVFGAGVWPDGTPTPYLQKRLDTAKRMQQAGKVQKILVSGDNSTEHYNEPVAMQNYLVSQGVPKDVVVLDYAGLSTYDTCYRAQDIFKVNKAYVTTQAYHLPRAVTTCRMLGIDTIGVESMRDGRDFTAAYLLREMASIYKAGYELALQSEPAVKGDPEPIVVE